MVKLNFIVEGPTEEAFVRSILTPYLSARGIYPYVRSVETSRRGTKIYRGGMTRYSRAREDILRWIKQEPDSYLTTMFDYYALPADFPGLAASNLIANLFEKIDSIEAGMKTDINYSKFIPYIQTHEFEALLFSDVTLIDSSMELYKQNGRLLQLEKIRKSFETPEFINNSEETAPSKRLLSIYPAYDKVFLGSLISQEIGIEKIKNECKRFAAWLNEISSLV